LDGGQFLFRVTISGLVLRGESGMAAPAGVLFLDAPALALVGAEQYVDQRAPGAVIRMRNDYHGLFSFVWELKPPHLELVFHSCSRVQPGKGVSH
jgi:hypothetical protein